MANHLWGVEDSLPFLPLDEDETPEL
jgi:hypothetical protein